MDIDPPPPPPPNNSPAVLKEKSQYFVYLLESTNKSTYIGATVDLTHRLRQHNCEIKGGATITSKGVRRGEYWERICHISGFPTWNAALQFEWRWKQLSRKFPKKMYPLERRIKALDLLLHLDKPTTKAVPYCEWDTPPKLNVEIESPFFICITGNQKKKNEI
jgi:structure-specific endonuclease subunit SLX1